MNGTRFNAPRSKPIDLQYKTTLKALQLHVTKSFQQYPEDLVPLFALTMAEPDTDMPREPGAKLSQTHDMIYAEQVKQYLKCETLLTSNKAAAHTVIWGSAAKQ